MKVKLTFDNCTLNPVVITANHPFDAWVQVYNLCKPKLEVYQHVRCDAWLQDEDGAFNVILFSLHSTLFTRIKKNGG